MIKVENGLVEISSTNNVGLLSDLTIAIKSVHKVLEERNSKEYADRKIQESVDLSKKTSEELNEMFIKKLNDVMELIFSKHEESSKEPTTGNKSFDDLLSCLFGRGDKYCCT